MASAASQAETRPATTTKPSKPSQTATDTTTTTTTLAPPTVTAADQQIEDRSVSVDELERGIYGPGYYRPRPQRRGGIVNQNSNFNSNSDYLSRRSSLYGQVYGSQQQAQRPNRPYYFGKSADDEVDQDEVEFDESEPAADAETVDVAEEKEGATEKAYYFGYQKPRPRPRPSSTSITNSNTNINTNSITDYSSLFNSLFSQLSSTQVQRPPRPGRPNPYNPYNPYFFGKSEDVAPEDDQAAEEESQQ